MNKKVLIIGAIVLVIIILLIVGFVLINNYKKPEIERNHDVKLQAMYQTLIDKLYEESNDFYSNVSYIALDLDGIEEVVKRDNVNIKKFNIIPNNNQKENLLNYCKKYNEDVMNAGFDELKAQVLYNEKLMCISGVLIYISSIEKISTNEVILNVVKYRSSEGAKWLRCKMQYEDNSWKSEVKMTAIS